eukprot:EG_transcript_13779
MEYQPLQTSSRPSRNMIWASCGTLLIALGVWWSESSTSTTNTHVQVQPKLDMQVGMLATQRQGTRSRAATLGQRDSAQGSSIARAAAAAPAAAAAAASGVGGPWLSILAIAVSLFAAVVAFLRCPEPTPAYYQPPRAVYEDPVPVPRKNSNAIDEIAISVKSDLASKKNVTPKQAILELQRGNARFWSGTPERPELNAMERRAIIIGQAPTVCILSCADSRVPVEIIFDQGLGSIFVVRVAGNILDSTAMGSIEFSVKYLGVKVLLVMGHEACGAVKGAMSMSNADLEQQPAYLQTVLRSIKANLKVDKLTRIRDNRAQDREAVVQNVSSQVKKLQENSLIQERVANGTLLVAGAFYEITSGIVDFFTLDKNGLVIDV